MLFSKLLRALARVIMCMGLDTVTPSSHVRNIGATFDKFLTMSTHIDNVCKSAFYHLRNIARVRRHLSFHTTEQLVHDFFTVKLDNNNALLYMVSLKSRLESYNEF